jgi:hypothetical protein
MKLTRKQLYESYIPGSLGYHELVHTTCVLAELFNKEIFDHPAAKHPELRKLVKRINSDLFTLYTKAACL